MADEATNVVLLGNQGDVIEVIVATGTAITKGTLMQLSSSPKTCTATSGANQAFLGIAAIEKTTTDGVTKFPLITHCIADLTCGAAETAVLGGLVMTGAAANEIDVADDSSVEGSSTQIVGMSLETIGNNGSGAVLINKGHQY